MGENGYDVIVVGVGGVGSATVYELAQRGVDVLGIERYDVPHAMGSSHGGTRVFRLAQYEHPDYVPLAERALERWRALEEASGRTLLRTTGSVHAGESGSAYVARIREYCDQHGVEYELLSGRELSARFPGYDLPEDHDVLYQPDGGFLDPERCISAHVTEATAAGATVNARERVTDWEATEDGVRVSTDKDAYRAARLVVTAGGWAGKFLPALRDWLEPQRRVMAWFQPETPEQFQPSAFPVFTISDEQSDVYGFPIHDRPGFKIGREPATPAVIDPDEPRPEPSNLEETAIRREAERLFPAAAGSTLGLRSCVLTESRDGHFLLGRHPEHERVTVGAGFTGHGFKFCSALGEVLADVSLTGDSEHRPALFDVERAFDGL